MRDQQKLAAAEGLNVVKTIRPGEDDAPLRTRRSEGASPGLPATMIRFAALAGALAVAVLAIVLLGD